MSGTKRPQVSTSSDTESECYKRPSRKGKKKSYKPDHKEHCTVKLKASTITIKQISQYFPNVEWVDLPSNTYPGEQLEGSTCQDILQGLLDDFRNTDFYELPTTVQNLTRNTCLPDNYIKHMREYIKPILDVLSNVGFQDKTSSQMVASYNEISCGLENQLKNSEVVFANYLLTHTMHIFVKRAVECHEKTHSSLLEFLKRLFEGFTIYKTNTKICAHDTVSLPIKMRTPKPTDQKTLGSMKVTYDMGLQSSPDETSGPKSSVDLELSSEPDILVERVHHLEDDEESSPEFGETYRCFIVEVKTTKNGFDIPNHDDHDQASTQAKDSKNSFSEGNSSRGRAKKRQVHARSSGRSVSPNLDPSTSKDVPGPTQRRRSTSGGKRSTSGGRSTSRNRKSSDTDRPWSPGSSRKAYGPHNVMAPRLENLPTQHFTELLSVLKSKDKRWRRQRCAFGFYVVMHRVYVTALHVHSKRKVSEADIREYIKLSDTEDYKELNRSTKMHFRMVCSKWFNLLKAEHFKAMVELLQYLVGRGCDEW